MAIEQLKNGSRHDHYAVDNVVNKLRTLQNEGLGGALLLVDLHRLATDHPKAQKIDDSQKHKLQETGLLSADGAVPQIVKDVLASATTGEEMSLVFTGEPYQRECSTAERTGVASDDRLGAMLEKLALLQKKGGRGQS